MHRGREMRRVGGTAAPIAAVVALVLAASCAGMRSAAPQTARPPGETGTSRATPALRLPWRDAGLDERQAAAHLLDRFAFGARPGEVDRVVAMGLDRWLEVQLGAALPDTDLQRRLSPLTALGLTARDMAATYPNPGTVLAEARAAGVVPAKGGFKAADAASRQEIRRRALEFARAHGFRPQRELVAQLQAQKVLRAVYSENQLREVLTDFFLNHFNVSLAKGQDRPWILSYERDAIRPRVLGRFRDLLGATAAHPAMLLYLDNALSVAPAGTETTAEVRRAGLARRVGPRAGGPGGTRADRGLNENYAREVMELHTLGVDAGYTQTDVIEVARAFTGWTVMPQGPQRENVERMFAAPQAARLGFVREGEFLFRAGAHDAEPKVVLGHRLPGGRGIEDGEEVLDILASSPATARHLARQLATRFVSDDPPPALVDRLAGVFTATGGDLRAVMAAIACSPEFWSHEALRAKVKSPFELAVSALRALDADVRDARGVVTWVGRMGEPLYAYQAPTGYPDRAQAWVNTGALLNRMNFGLQLATGRVGGVRFDLLALNHNREPESAEAALDTYARLVLPGRSLDETVRLLTPAMQEPAFAGKVDAAAPARQDARWEAEEEAELFGDTPAPPVAAPPPRPSVSLPYVVGLILGSPEFQRR